MTSPAYSVDVDAPLETALRLMATARVTGLPVVDGHGRVVGIISEADLLRSELVPDPRAHARPARKRTESAPATVGQTMTVNPHTVREDTDVAELARTFASTSWKSVPVVRGEALLGVVSRSDVIRALSRSDEETASEISRTFAEMGLHTVRVEVNDGVAQVAGAASDRERDAAIAIAGSVRGVRQVTTRDSTPD